MTPRAFAKLLKSMQARHGLVFFPAFPFALCSRSDAKNASMEAAIFLLRNRFHWTPALPQVGGDRDRCTEKARLVPASKL